MKKFLTAIVILCILVSSVSAITPCGQTVTTAGLTTTAVTAPLAQSFTESLPGPTVTVESGALTTLADFTTGSASAPACTSIGEDIIIEEQRDDTEKIEGTIRTNDYLAVVTTDPVAGSGSPRDKIRIRCKDPDDFSTVINDVEVDLSPTTTIVNPKLASAGKANTNTIAITTHLANGNLLTLSYNCDTDTLDQIRNGGFSFLDSSDGIVTNLDGVYVAAREGGGGDLLVIKFDTALSTVLAAEKYDLPQSIIAPQIIATNGLNAIIVGAFRTTIGALLLITLDSDIGFQGMLQIDHDVTANPPEELDYDSAAEMLVVRDSETLTAVDTSSILTTGATLNSFETSTDGGVFSDVSVEDSKALTGGLTLNFLGAIGEYTLTPGTGLVLNYWKEDPDNQILEVIKDANGNPWVIGFDFADSTKTAISKYETDGTGISYSTANMDFGFFDITRELAKDDTGIYAGYTYRDSADFNPTNTYVVKIDAPLAAIIPEFGTITIMIALLGALLGVIVLRKRSN